uniref:Uncharacterized protein n=1 Tax=Cucumis melo TaxID=3656 RepID=A0A9I9DEW0_CUCME
MASEDLILTRYLYGLKEDEELSSLDEVNNDELTHSGSFLFQLLVLNPVCFQPSIYRFPSLKTCATLDGKDPNGATPVLVQEESSTSSNIVNEEVEKSVKVLKNAAKTRKVPAEEVLSALSVLEKAKLDPSNFFNTLGGTSSPGRTWMLIFTAEKKLKKGRYFPVTAIQRFDAAGKRIENGVFLGPIGSLTFEGRLSWKTRILAFIFERVRIKIGPLNPLEISLGQKEEREPSTKDPCFIWFYVDEEIAVARGRSGGTAFWCRCRRVTATSLWMFLGDTVSECSLSSNQNLLLEAGANDRLSFWGVKRSCVPNVVPQPLQPSLSLLLQPGKLPRHRANPAFKNDSEAAKMHEK